MSLQYFQTKTTFSFPSFLWFYNKDYILLHFIINVLSLWIVYHILHVGHVLAVTIDTKFEYNIISIWEIVLLITKISISISIRMYFSSHIIINSLLKIREDINSLIINSPILFFREQKKGDVLTEIIASGIQGIENLFTKTIPSLIRHVSLLIGAIYCLVKINLVLGVYIATISPLILGLVFTFFRYLKKNRQKYMDTLKKTDVIFLDIISNILILKSSKQDSVLYKKYNKYIPEIKRNSLLMAKHKILLTVVIIYSLFIFLLILSKISAYSVINGSNSTGELISFFFYFFIIVSSLTNLLAGNTTLQKEKYTISIMIQKIFHNMNYKYERIVQCRFDNNSANQNDTPQPIPFKTLQLENISYQKGMFALNKVNITIKTGQTIAIIGSSGAGKSTIFDLLMSLIQPTEGNFLINEIDYKQFSLPQIRQLSSVVPQHITLLNDTVLNNIIIYNPNISKEDLNTRLIDSGISNIIKSFPNGLDTPLDTHNTPLSGGQIQAIAIARALVSDRPILLFDEPTTHLDLEIARSITQNILSIKKTKVIISHNLSAINIADIVFIIDNGTIIAQGTPQSLAQDKTSYYSKLLHLGSSNT
ncbi:MAG: ABC transporter family protein [Candidatus Xenolissoclinum pacificiensis L6]|uniref:ABC transporter family protein n=1 Tax=Candidatus Xenolissoclinum pacificiensis L6 TaxID=1401685 RepID=W2UYT1_9RICK|nr:MAG: ABC transporter family protein [Candidatus Xenolissoclinum pacificiensis L6]